jgi:hypothetical protein
MNNVMKLGLTLIAVLFATGCAGNQAARDYYMAVQSSAQAKAQADTARYAALAKMAGNGGEASVAATMAIALTQPQTITPQYIESETLKWAQVLTPGVTTLGLGLVQAGVAKNASNNAAQVQMASFASQEAIQLGQQNMVSNLGNSWATTAAGSADLAVAGFNALNTAGQQTVDLGIAGLNTADSIAGAGFDANTNIATAGFDATTTVAGLGFATVDSIATTGFATVDSVATTGMEGMATLGLAGMTGIENVGIAGLTNLNEVSQYGMTTISAVSLAGMNGMENLGTAGMTNLTTLGTTGIDAVSTVGTTGMNLLDSQGTNYTAIIADMQNTIDLISQELADPITCSPNADGLYVCQ